MEELQEKEKDKGRDGSSMKTRGKDGSHWKRERNGKESGRQRR